MRRDSSIIDILDDTKIFGETSRGLLWGLRCVSAMRGHAAWLAEFAKSRAEPASVRVSRRDTRRGKEMRIARSVYDIPLTALSGEPLDPGSLRGRAALIVNVASRCGFTPQYEKLQRVFDRYRERGLVVVGAPCNQFGSQEPGTAEEIAEFCSDSYAVTFPLTSKLDVNGENRHPLFSILGAQPDQSGVAGDIQWNFEKFLVSARGKPVARFRSATSPEAPEVVQAVERILPGTASPEWVLRSAQEVEPGDRVRLSSGMELTATRIKERFLDRAELICLIEDTPTRWLAQPIQLDDEVHILSAS